MTSPKTLYTAEDLLHFSSAGKRFELVRGEFVEMAPTGARHGRAASRIDFRLRAHAEREGAGEVFAAETGFRLQRGPDTVRSPDVAFVATGRLPHGDLPSGFPDLAPDLAVEVVSPNDRASEVQAKVEDWLRAGTRLVWVVYPDTRSITVFQGLSEVRVLTEGDNLDGAPVLPGFSCRVVDLF